MNVSTHNDSALKTPPTQEKCPPHRHLQHASDRVLCGEFEESLVAAEGCSEAEKCQVVAGIA
ncbi:hypothetical protein ACFWC5_43225, partial [Streptomyces sp. NPDC060085]|uniref:hypothetical protein n=1 Tax=Streptomyces sp. NPDC060085 TaxID=3347054 RepID=UPI003669F089